jgi:hypothetical protein
MDGNQPIKRTLQLGSRYPRQVARVRVGVGIWLLFLTAFLYGTGHGGKWGWLLPLTAVLHFGLAYRLSGIARKDSDRRTTFQ